MQNIELFTKKKGWERADLRQEDDEPVEIDALEDAAVSRNGFTFVEWGGTQLQ